MSLYGSDPNIGQQMADQQARQDALTQQGLQQINQRFAKFDDNFFNQRAQAYEQYAMPQLQTQYAQERNAVGFGLANRGLAGSAAARQQYSDLGKEMVTKEQGIVDQGQNLAQQLRQQVNAAKSNLISELGAATTPGAASQQALAAASTFSAPSPFAPLGNQFQDFNTALMLRQALANPQGTQTTVPLNTQGTTYDAPSAPIPNSSYQVA